MTQVETLSLQLGKATLQDDGECAKLKHFLKQRNLLLHSNTDYNYLLDFHDILQETQPVTNWSEKLGIARTQDLVRSLNTDFTPAETHNSVRNDENEEQDQSMSAEHNNSNNNNNNYYFSSSYTTTCIGEGACGLVYKVQSVEPSSQCKVYAVKRFSPRVLNENVKYFYEKIIIEYEIGKILSSQHLNFIKIYGLYVDQYSPSVNGNNYDEYHHELTRFPKFSMLMDYAEFDFIDLVLQTNATLTTHEIHCYFKQIMDAVRFMHENCNMVHRDLKLDNCVIVKPGVLKLIDFGSTILLDKEIEKQYLNTVVGSDPYLAPEILSSSKYLAKPVDIWSVGIIYYCMVMKKFPWTIPTKDDVSFKLFSNGLAKAIQQGDNDDDEEDFYSFKNDLDDSDDEEEEEEEEGPGYISKGAQRILQDFDPEIRPLLNGILAMDPVKRFTISDVFANPCFQKIPCCFETFDDLNHHMYDHNNTHFFSESLTK